MGETEQEQKKRENRRNEGEEERRGKRGCLEKESKASPSAKYVALRAVEN